MQILSLRHSCTHLPPSPTLHESSPQAPNQWCSTLLICQLYIRCSPQQQQQHAAAAAAGRPRQRCGTRGVAAVHRAARRQQRADRSEVVPRGRRGQRLQPAVVAAVEVRAKRQELAEDLLAQRWDPMDGWKSEPTGESIFNGCLGLFLSIILFSEEWLHLDM